MKVIFTQDVRGRGQRGQIKEVPDGYAQNYLIKRGLAKQATKAAMSQLKGQQRAEEKHAAEELAIKALGYVNVPIKLHPEVEAQIRVHIAEK